VSAVLGLHQALQVFDVPDGGPQRLHLAEPLVGVLTRQVVPQLGVALVHALYPLTLALIPLLDERWLKRTLVDAEVSVVVEGGQVGQEPRATVAPQRALVEAEAGGFHAGGVEEEGDGAGPRVRVLGNAVTLAESSRGRHAEAIQERVGEGGAHHVIQTDQ